MAKPRANILVIDDLKDTGEFSKESIQKERGYRVASPPSLKELKNLTVFETFESALVDIDLTGWDLSERLYGQKIYNGIDIAKFLYRINNEAGTAIGLYSAKIGLNDLQTNNQIRQLAFKPKLIGKPIPHNANERREKFRPVLDEAGRSRRASPIYQPPEFGLLPLEKRVHTYKSIYLKLQAWIDFHFRTVGDFSWLVICGRRVEKSCYGDPLNGKGHIEFGREIGCSRGYPTSRELIEISRKQKHFPFILWNARKPAFVESQLSVDRLSCMPVMWRHFFSVAIAIKCAEFYIAEDHHRVLKWCQHLNEPSKLEAAKLIFDKLLSGEPNQLARFKRLFSRNRLPVIVEIFEGRVDEIDNAGRTAWVELIKKTSTGEKSFFEPFDIRRLARAGVKYEDQPFRYTVYEIGTSIAMNIEPTNVYE